MDLGSVIGNILVWILILSSMALGVGIAAYVDAPSTLIVIGGCTGALLIANKPDQMAKFGKVFMVSIKPKTINYVTIIQKVTDYATQSRRDGLLSLEATVNNEEEEFLKKGLMLVVDGVEPDIVKTLLEIEMEGANTRHMAGIEIFGSLSAFSGAYGLIGTLIGLVAMLVNMSDPSAIGPSMAVALLTTLYGAMIANMIAGPVSKILTARNDDEMLAMGIMIEGVVSIQAGDNPRILESKLMSYLHANLRVSQFD